MQSSLSKSVVFIVAILIRAASVAVATGNKPPKRVLRITVDQLCGDRNKLRFRSVYSEYLGRCCLTLLLCMLVSIQALAENWDGDGVIEPGENETAELARAAQNPVANLISVPFQLNSNYDYGPDDKTQHTLNIQPVIPFELNNDWNLITRTIVPVVSNPSLVPGGDRETGLGDTTFTAFLSPTNGGKLLWGAGPVMLIPTNTDDQLGPDEWGAGPSVVVLTMPGNWVLGSLFSQVWGINEDNNNDISLFTWQYFVNYNLSDGWYLTSAPIITANWEAERDSQKWTIPIGGGVGKIVRFGKLPVNISAQVYYNAAKPDYLGDWSSRIQFQFLFPKKKQ